MAVLGGDFDLLVDHWLFFVDCDSGLVWAWDTIARKPEHDKAIKGSRNHPALNHGAGIAILLGCDPRAADREIPYDDPDQQSVFRRDRTPDE
jgi:hypothetical protein